MTAADWTYIYWKSNTWRTLSYATPIPKEYTACAHSYNPLALLLPRGKLSSTASVTTPTDYHLAWAIFTLPLHNQHLLTTWQGETWQDFRLRSEWTTTTFTFPTGCRLRMPNPYLIHVYRKILLYLFKVVFEQASISTLTAGKLEQEVRYKLLVQLEKGEMQTEPRYASRYPTVQSQAMVPHWETKQIWIPFPLVFKNMIISAIQL